jgi:hypothetical protein
MIKRMETDAGGRQTLDSHLAVFHKSFGVLTQASNDNKNVQRMIRSVGVEFKKPSGQSASKEHASTYRPGIAPGTVTAHNLKRGQGWRPRECTGRNSTCRDPCPLA